MEKGYPGTNGRYVLVKKNGGSTGFQGGTDAVCQAIELRTTVESLFGSSREHRDQAGGTQKSTTFNKRYDESGVVSSTHQYAERLFDGDPGLRLVEVVRVLAAGKGSAGVGDEHSIRRRVGGVANDEAVGWHLAQESVETRMLERRAIILASRAVHRPRDDLVAGVADSLSTISRRG